MNPHESVQKLTPLISPAKPLSIYASHPCSRSNTTKKASGYSTP